MKKKSNIEIICFLTAIIFGIITHSFIMLNDIPNHDGISSMFGTNYGVESGRWLLSNLYFLDGTHTNPWISGIMGIIIIGFSAVLVLKVLGIKDKYMAAALGALMVSFPAVGASMHYIYTFVPYMVALLFSVASVYLINHNRLVSALFLGLSMAIYQPYLAFNLVLFTLFVLRLIVDGEKANEIKKVIMNICISVIGGGLFYYISMKMSLIGLDLVEYGRSGMFSGSILGFLNEYFIMYRTGMGRLVHIFIPAIFMILGASVILVFRATKYKWAFLGLCFMTILFSVSLVFVFGVGASHMLTQYALIAPILLAMVVVRDSRIKTTLLVLVALTVTGFAVNTNASYVAAQRSFHQAISFYNRMLTRVEAVDGYNASMAIIILGDPAKTDSVENYTLNKLNDTRYSFTGRNTFDEYLTTYRLDNLINFYCGYKGKIHYKHSHIAAEANGLGAIANMEFYPAAGSFKIMSVKGEDVLVVRFRP